MGKEDHKNLGLGGGLPADKYGNATVDPTKNVLDLVEASVRRIDDLRDAETKRVDEVLLLRAQRFDEITELHFIQTKELMSLRAEHSKDLMIAEAKRIDAIRVVDVQAVQVANSKSADQAVVLANQVSASAETLRKLVETTAAAAATQFQQVTMQLSDRIASLEKSQYEGAGKQAVADPQLALLIAEVRNLTSSRDTGTGKGIGMKDIWSIIVVVLGLLIAASRFLPGK